MGYISENSLPITVDILRPPTFDQLRRDIQRLGRAMLRQPQAAILTHGQIGVGKTSLAKGFLRWLSQTGRTAGGGFLV